MDFTPDRSMEAPLASFNESSVAKSTPLVENSRKRKRNEIESSWPTPPHCSTLNDSLLNNLKAINLETSDCSSAFGTPEKQIRGNERLIFNPVGASPIQESRKILYNGGIKFVNPERKISFLSPFKQCDEGVSRTAKLFQSVITNEVIMDCIFQHLSNGDLYRFGNTSKQFLKVLLQNPKAKLRYSTFKETYKVNKENYIITPPSSPEKCDSPPRLDNEYCNKFAKVARTLTRSQSLNKCRSCSHPVIVDNDICQCQSVSCGLIYCLKCDSYSETGPENFKDLCGNSILRPRLRNVSNCMEDSFYSNTFNFSSQDSGFYSEGESPPKVRRSLFSSLNDSSKVFSLHNRNLSVKKEKEQMKKNYVQVISTLSTTTRREATDCDSPPRERYSMCSKQSKRNLKRLTR